MRTKRKKRLNFQSQSIKSQIEKLLVFSILKFLKKKTIYPYNLKKMLPENHLILTNFSLRYHLQGARCIFHNDTLN